MTSTFREDTDEGRLDLDVDGTNVGHINYDVDGSVATIAHTEVDTAFEGNGYGGELVRESLRRFDERGMTVRPTCPFALAWIKQHPEFAAQVDSSMQAQVASNGHGQH
ncbi:MAG: N-acetyltransferase [Thermoleophilia bacterium]|nr:N-acetyltransferase [Thermoleophilia bacterium]